MKYAVETVETVHRLYVVEAKNEDEARSRAQLYFRDPEVVAGGLVTTTEHVDLKHRRIVGIKQAAQVKAADEARDPSADS